MKKVRVRFAPSPTGPLHIGGVRTALYNYLLAKQNSGDFILRIEDTDSTRFVPEAEEYIIDSLRWLGIMPTEGIGSGDLKSHGPYRQSERRSIYCEYIDKLVKMGKAYIAFDTPEELEMTRAKIHNFQYNSKTRLGMKNSLSMTEEEVKAEMNSGKQYTIRFKVEPGQTIEFEDLIRGSITVNSDNIDDKILWKSSDGLPTYHFANVVDDHLMEISHVIRGEEWIPSTPLHCLLYEAFGWDRPEFAHLPLILKPAGMGKLAKRDGDSLGFPVYPLQWKDPKTGEISSGYRERGWFPEAVVNYLAFLGWNPGTEQEIFSMDELIEIFSLKHVQKSGARFDNQKAIWFNHEYILRKRPEDLLTTIQAFFTGWGADTEKEKTLKIIELMKDRVNFIHELWPLCEFFFFEPSDYDEKSVKKFWKENSKDILPIVPFEKGKEYTCGWIEGVSWIENNKKFMGEVMNALRVAVVGKAIGPEMFAIIDVLGIDEVRRRINKAIEKLG